MNARTPTLAPWDPFAMRQLQRPLFQEIAAAAEEVPTKTFYRFLDGPSATYSEVWTTIQRVAGSLQNFGVTAGNRVALMLDNCEEFLEAWYGIQAAGAIAVPLNTALRGDVLKHQLDLSSPRVLIARHDLLDRVRQAVGLPDYLEKIVTVDGAVEADDRALTFEELREDSGFEPVDVGPDDVASILYTSGTTGPSKGVTWTHHVSIHCGETCRAYMGYTQEDVIYTCLPLYHGNALNLSLAPAILARGTVVFGRRFSRSGFWSDIKEAGATATNLLGAMSPLLLQNEPDERERDHNVRTALVIPSPPEYYDVFPERFGFSPIEAYGLTDVGMVFWKPTDRTPPRGSCGLPVEGFQVRLVDEHGNEVERGQGGELVVRNTWPGILPAGYWEMPERTLEVWRDLWWHTGDLLKQDEAGWFYFIDRQKDAIRRRGENISSFEVEQALLSHEAVLECAAYGVPSEFLEEEIAVAVVLEPGAELSEVELLGFVEPKLPHFAVPRFVTFVKELPKTQTEKVKKMELRDLGVMGAWDREAVGYRVSR